MQLQIAIIVTQQNGLLPAAYLATGITCLAEERIGPRHFEHGAWKGSIPYLCDFFQLYVTEFLCYIDKFFTKTTHIFVGFSFFTSPLLTLPSKLSRKLM